MFKDKRKNRKDAGQHEKTGVSMLLSASVKRFSVSRIRDFSTENAGAGAVYQYKRWNTDI